jgi:hypothetical protein
METDLARDYQEFLTISEGQRRFLEETMPDECQEQFWILRCARSQDAFYREFPDCAARKRILEFLSQARLNEVADQLTKECERFDPCRALQQARLSRKNI